MANWDGNIQDSNEGETKNTIEDLHRQTGCEGSIRDYTDIQDSNEGETKNTIEDLHRQTGCEGSIRDYTDIQDSNEGETKNTIEDLHRQTGCEGSIRDYTDMGEFNAEETKSIIEDHHRQTGCEGSIRDYTVDNHIQGFFCLDCKQEWFRPAVHKHRLETEHVQLVAHHVVPNFICLQVSDTGFHVKWEELDSVKGLKRGDHVAWLRFCFGYWHHAIVEEVSSKYDGITVIEWCAKKCNWSVRRVSKNKCSTWCYSPMFKVSYPANVLTQNPPDLVLMRAKSRLEDTGYSLCSDNCEHFATFCKTGVHCSNQLLQWALLPHAWCRKLLMIFIHLAVVVTLAEETEAAVDNDSSAVNGTNDKMDNNTDVFSEHKVGAVLLFVFELLYVAATMCFIFKHDYPLTRQLHMHRCPACVCASVKVFLQSVLVVVLSVVFSVLVLEKAPALEKLKSKTLCEIALGIFGGMLGNMFGIFIVFLLSLVLL